MTHAIEPNEYDKGDLVRCTGTFTNAAGTATDPATVNFKMASPSGTVTTYVYLTDAQLVKDSTGVYHVDVDGSVEGTWHFRFYATGSGQAASEGTFIVHKSHFS